MATNQKSVKKSSDEVFEQQDFDLFRALEAIDKKDYNWFSKLTEEQQRKFVSYMLIYWTSTVKGNSTLASYYLLSTNNYANVSLFNDRVQQHPALQWLMLCASSPGMGKQFHQWLPHLNLKIGTLKSKASVREVAEYFSKIYKGADESAVKEYASEFTSVQNHKYKIANIFPNMKLEDINVLSNLVTTEEIENYEQESGN
jgi:hypothetical protein